MHRKGWTAVWLALLIPCVSLLPKARADDSGSGSKTARANAYQITFDAQLDNFRTSVHERADGTVWIPGGKFWMGSAEVTFTDAQPWHQVYVDGFWMSRTLVTNSQFRKFADETGYITSAEQKPRSTDIPGVSPDQLVAGSAVFLPPVEPVDLHDHLQWWRYVTGASWKHPEGPESSVTNEDNYPVVQVAWRDAEAYCKWSGGRLPTEAEYEFAQRGGLEKKRYGWGDEYRQGGKYMANTFQGHFPDRNNMADGYAGTSPVSAFPANQYGLYDITGNVWEWTSDWYRSDYYQSLVSAGEIARNPLGPLTSFDPEEPGIAKRVQRGGSFLCSNQYCSRYIAGARGKADPDTATDHTGFRCVYTH
jgi:formylglycine-generating enzyme